MISIYHGIGEASINLACLDTLHLLLYNLTENSIHAQDNPIESDRPNYSK